MKNLIWLKSAFVISLFLIFTEIPMWATLAACLMFSWKILLDIQNWQPPSKLMTGVLALSVLVFSRLHYGSFLGRENAATLFLVLGALKLLEMANPRDRQFCRFLILGALAVKFLFAIELWVFAPALVGTFFIFLDLRNASKTTVKKESLLIIKTWGYALPFALFFFFVFPRFQSPFGSNQNRAITGFAPSLGPGSVAQLAQSREPVMRVSYTGKKNDDGYWVGDYLYHSEGLSWNKGSEIEFETKKLSRSKFSDQVPDYTVTLEPHQFSTLFAISGTEALQVNGENVFRVSDGIFLTDHPIMERIQYSGFLAKTDQLNVFDSSDDKLLQHPEISEKIKQTFQYIKANSQWSRNQIVNELVSWLKKGNFKYSLNPGTDSKNLDEFILVGKKGFCEHYTAAFATILRYLGVPTRTVVGYQGGEWNAVGSYWLITQQDAHAWIEFLNDKGKFERLDLVSFLAPDRLIFGAKDFSERFDSATGTISAKSESLFSAVLFFKNSILLWIDSINYLWIQFLIDFDFEKQKEIFFKFKDLWPVFLIAVMVVVGGFSIIKQSKINQKKDFPTVVMRKLLYEATQKGWVSAENNQGPLSLKSAYDLHLKNEAADRIFNSYLAEKYYGGPKSNYTALRKDFKIVKTALKSLK